MLHANNINMTAIRAGNMCVGSVSNLLRGHYITCDTEFDIRTVKLYIHNDNIYIVTNILK